MGWKHLLVGSVVVLALTQVAQGQVPCGTISDLGLGLANGGGVPELTIEGDLCGGTPITAELENGPVSEMAFICVGVVDINLPFMGGIFVPDVSAPGFVSLNATDALGQIDFDKTWPAGVPPGFELYVQFWMVDPGGPQGFSASNAVLLATT